MGYLNKRVRDRLFMGDTANTRLQTELKPLRWQATPHTVVVTATRI